MSRADALSFREIKSDSWSGAYLARQLRYMTELFAFGVQNGFCSENPFAGVTGGKDWNPKRHFFVTRSVIAKVLGHCQDDRDRLAVALGRFGGLRVPSEILGLTFGDFGQGVIRVHANTKTGIREVPFFLEIRAIFDRLGKRVSSEKTRYTT